MENVVILRAILITEFSALLAYSFYTAAMCLSRGDVMMAMMWASAAVVSLVALLVFLVQP